MHQKSTLSSISEMEADEGIYCKKWVPKKKHELLKAKYKCLKRLFQIYDATVIGALPNQTEDTRITEDEPEPETYRRKRSHRAKTDASAGTNEVLSNCELSNTYEHISVDTATVPLANRSCISTQIDQPAQSERFFDRSNLPLNLVTPYNLMLEKRKLTRFQNFVQRLFGLRNVPNEFYSVDSVQKRRRGLRFRRLSRAKAKSDGSLRDLKSPIFSYVQSVQRNCLMDTTPRQCPIPGCKMILYGIINYNDHLNLCHLKGRKFFCHYCHEGFEVEMEKVSHENEHIGISKMNSNTISIPAKIASDTQTEGEKFSEDKLRKIVSYFDKISDRGQLSNVRNKSCEALKCESGSEQDKISESGTNMRSNNKSVSSASVSSSTNRTLFLPVVCHFCGEHFAHRRQLSLHVNLVHRAHDRFSKYQSCVGLNLRAKSRTALSLTDGMITVKSDQPSSDDVRRMSSVACDINSSKVFYSSESVLPIETARYHWEPGTKGINA